MSRFDQDREKVISLINSICDYISTHNNCNNCEVSSCEYKPKCGEFARWNCPLWQGVNDA